MDLRGKTALVTGAGRGIGRGCALALAAAGADIIANDRPGSPDLESVRAEIEALGRRCISAAADVFSREGCEGLFRAALASVGRIDVVVSNPAFGQRGNFLDYDPALFEKTIQGTLTSGFHIAQLAARHMVEQGIRGKIIFISSVQAEMPYSQSVAYNAAKAGLNHMARSIAVELSGHRINVNVIEPGWIDTPKERETFGPEMMAREAEKLPWGRLGTPADIGRMAAFLASDGADYVTGATFPVDGGFLWKDCRSTDAILPVKKPAN